MQFAPLRVGRVRVAVATSTALVLIVAAVLAWLGWRMSRQDTELSRQARLLRLNFYADGFLRDFQWQVGDTEDNLFQIDATTALQIVRAQRPSFAKRDALLVRLTEAGIENDLTEESGSRLTPAERLAFSQVLESLHNEWREFREGRATTLNKRITTSGVVSVLTLIDANPTRLVASVFLGERAITNLLVGPLMSQAPLAAHVEGGNAASM